MTGGGISELSLQCSTGQIFGEVVVVPLVQGMGNRINIVLSYL